MLDLSLTAIFPFLVLVYFIKSAFSKRSLDHIPSVGYSNPLLSYFTAIKYLLNGRSYELMEIGYRKFPDRAFKIPFLEKWVVVVNGPKLIDDIRRGSGQELSLSHSLAEFFQYDYLLGPNVTENPYHVNVVRQQLTRNLDARFADMHEEMILAWNDAIPCHDNEWVSISAFNSVMDVVSKVTAQLFVGFPLCRDPDFRKICVQFSMEIVKGRALNFFPASFRWLAVKLLNGSQKMIERTSEYLGPIIEYRLEQEKIHGQDWSGKPNDLISWLLEEATAEERSVRNLTVRFLLLVFGSISTTSMALTNVLYDIATSEHLLSLREEVESVIKEKGWTRESINSMPLLDSFLRENQRLNGAGILTLGRRVMKDFFLSDGTFLPAGCSVACNAWATHHDDRNFKNAHEFDEFRFAPKDGSKQQLMVTPKLDYLPFGHGRTACPGRFFAAMELKMMLAHIIVHYDLKMEHDGVRPLNTIIETSVIPDSMAKILFRKHASS